jgi:predicted transglutaminase-like cysteine proteinase
MMAATIALGAVSPSTAQAAPAEQARYVGGDFFASQSATSNISNRFGQVPSWSTSVKSDSAQRLADFDTMIKASQSLSFEGKVNAVNEFYNKKIAYMEDIDAWGVKDYWATPLETLKKGAGDCEDFAIAKYFALEQLGVPREALKITYVKSDQFKEAHMVLLASKSQTADPLVLDNMKSSASPFSRRHDLKAVYSFNEEALFMGVSKTSASGIDRMEKWTDLLHKVGNETRMLGQNKGPNPYDMSRMSTKSVAQTAEGHIEIQVAKPAPARTRHAGLSGPDLG